MAYTGTSIVDYLKSTGGASDFASRAALATQKGITGYTGTAAQNTQLLGILRAPAPSPLTQGQSFTDPAGRTGIVNFDANTGARLQPGQTTTPQPSFNFAAQQAEQARLAEITRQNKVISDARAFSQTGAGSTGISSFLDKFSADDQARINREGVFGTNITSTNIGRGTDITIPPPAPSDTTTASQIFAGATAEMTRADEAYRLAQENEAKTRTTATDISTRISALLPSLEGRGAAQTSAEQQFGVTEKTQALANVNAQIQTKLAEYQALSVDVQGKPITMQSIIGSQAQIRNVAGAEIGMLQAQSAAIQGNLTVAQNAADRSVDLKYADARAVIETKISQLRLIEPILNAQEQITANALKEKYQIQKNEMAVQISNEKDINSTKLNQMQIYPDAGITLQDTIESANTKITTNSKIYQDKIKQTRFAPAQDVPTTRTFTQAQINKGASNAGLEIATFGNLDEDVKNFFINPQKSNVPKGDPNYGKTVASVLKDSIKSIVSGAQTKETVSSNISSSNLPQPVKDYFIALVENATEPANKTQPWYNKLWGWIRGK